jgi:hypothetical protein
MSLTALIPNGVMAAWAARVSSWLATASPLSRLQKQRISLTCLKTPVILALALVFLTLATILPQTSLAAWSPTGPLNVARELHTATLLPNGQVLVAGGWSNILSSYLTSAELYDQAFLGFTGTSPMFTARAAHTATLLPNGKVLVVAGQEDVTSAELYDPPSWSPAGAMNISRWAHTATLLPNGKVLVAGGISVNLGPGLASAQIFDPVSGSWYTTPPMGTGRLSHTATLLPNGKVLVAGGDVGYTTSTNRAELYDPLSGWSPTASLGTGRWGHTATLLLNGKVLVVGGTKEENLSLVSLASAEIYDPAANGGVGAWTATNPMGTPRSLHTATLLLDGKVLVTGGYNGGYLSSAELYDPASGTWSPAGLMSSKRGNHTATRLSNGKVLVAGGSDSNIDITDSAELYEQTNKVLKIKLPRLLAFYPFDFGPMDVSGNGRHAQMTGNPLLVPGFLDQGQAYSFNGATDYLTAPLDINPNQYPKLTMGCWAKTASLLPWWQHQPVLTHDNDGFDRAIAIDWRANGFDLDGNPNAVGWSAFGGAEGQVLGGEPAILDQWTFLAVVYDQTAGTVKFQVDDMMFTKTGATLGLGRDKLLIGFRPGTSSFPIDTYFAGAIDNVFIFGDALSDEQLAYIRSGGTQAIMTAARKANPGILFLLLED